MTQSLARALHFELEENQRELVSARFSGLSQANPIRIDGVYRSLLASGNIRYLHKHQESLYRLYSMKSSDDPKLLDALEVAMVGVGDAASPFVRKRLAAARRAP